MATLIVDFVSVAVALAAVWTFLATFGVAMSLLLVQIGIGDMMRSASGWTPSAIVWFIILLLLHMIFSVVFFAMRSLLTRCFGTADENRVPTAPKS
jgi:tryptophan-rich sensory protein